jgi:hypothetical protein
MLIRTLPELNGQFNQPENSPMIVTSSLSIDIVRYLDRRNQGVPLRWTLLSEIADHVYGPEDLAFNQAVDLARLRGWIIVEGKSPWRRAGQTKAGCSLVLQEASATPTAARNLQLLSVRRRWRAVHHRAEH